jgi:hypothetical protein
MTPRRSAARKVVPVAMGAHPVPVPSRTRPSTLPEGRAARPLLPGVLTLRRIPQLAPRSRPP